MSKKNLINFDFIIECLEYVRERKIRIGFAIFFYLNWHNSFQAAKYAFVMFNFKLVGDFELGISAERDEMYWDLFSTNTAMIFAHTIVSAIFAIFITFLIIQMIDYVSAPKALMSPNLRRLRKWRRKETKLLETQGSLIRTLEREEILKDEAFKIIKDFEEIVKRYEQTSMALNPNLNKRPKLSEKDKTIGDLFDEEPKLNDRPKGLKKFVRFIRKL